VRLSPAAAGGSRQAPARLARGAGTPNSRSCAMIGPMSDKPSDVFSGLPRARPHRRSDKRPAAPAEGGDSEPLSTAEPKAAADAAKAKPAAARRKPAAARRKPAGGAARAKPTRTPPRPTRRARSETLRQPAQPGGTPGGPRARKPAPVSGTEILGTAVQAAAELVEIGLSASARAVRNAIARLPRP
jgi:hypothetical protein